MQSVNLCNISCRKIWWKCRKVVILWANIVYKRITIYDLKNIYNRAFGIYWIGFFMIFMFKFKKMKYGEKCVFAINDSFLCM